MKKKEKMSPHIIAATAFVVFIVLGLACATLPGGNPTVDFNANGGNGTVPSSQRVKNDSSITLPDGRGLSFGDATFGGWLLYASDGTATIYPAGSSFTPTSSVTLYAKWELDAVDLDSATGLANKLVWLLNNVKSGGSYTIELNANERIEHQLFDYNGKNNITITIRGIGTNRIITPLSNGVIFSAGDGVTLILDNNITLQGRSEEALATVYGTGKLIMNAGSAITGSNKGGVEVWGGTFTMNGGTISGNGTCGVAVRRDGTFTMNDGTISGNKASGVWIVGGIFNMTGGTISGNIAAGGISSSSGGASGSGGGVYIQGIFGGTFNMSGGTISNNTSGYVGGGVAVGDGTFTMTGGTITGNTALEKGGVWVSGTGRFNNRGGTVSGNRPDR